MGGNALKETAVCRLTQPDYLHVAKRVTEGLLEAIPGARVFPIPAYREKADFGDLDIMLTLEPLVAAGGVELIREIAHRRFNAKQIVHNGPVWSFDFREVPQQESPGFQVDVIVQEMATFDYGTSYFSFNDLGNLIGRIAHKMGTAHRHDGLYWYYRDGSHMFREICLTLDHAQALAFLGFDSESYSRGFDSLEDIYRYVASSKFFNKDIYLLENRNHASRTRDRKRKTYMGFLDWCAKTTELPAFDFPVDKLMWLPRLNEHFVRFAQEYAKAQADLRDSRLVKERYNGARISKLTGYTGARLGAFMGYLRSRFSNAEYLRQFMMSQSIESIEAFVLDAKVQFDNRAGPSSSLLS